MKTTKTTKIVAALGITAGLGLAALPAFSYAAEVSGDVKVETEVESSLAMRIHSNADVIAYEMRDCDMYHNCTPAGYYYEDTYGFIGYNPATAQGSTDPAATASGTASQATGLTLSSNQADTTTLYSNISVRSNTGKFKVEVQDTDTDTAMRNESGSTTENQYIPAGVTTTEENGETIINPGIAGWALKGGDIASWTAITASDASPLTVKALDTNTTNPLAYSSDITVNYAVSSGLTKTDTYSDTITYTATALDSDYNLEPTSLSEIDNMQEMNPTIVANAEVGDSKTLTDTRGGSYTVAKLADGNIWMTQNLNLYNKTLTPEDSDVSSNFTIPDSSTANWCTENSAACDNQSMALYSDNASYGTYYNWYTATAGTGTYEMASGDATSSICPKGWKLPTNAQFQAMYDQYGSSAAIRATGTNQPAYVLSGNRYGGSTDYQGSNGYYWASTALSSINVYYLNLGSSSVHPQNASGKWYGFSVRCIAATQ